MTTGYTVHDEHVVDLFLLEAETDDTADLKAALLELRSFAAGPPVAPSAKLAELMETGPAAHLDALRQRRHRRTAVTALAVAASMGIGAAAVAAADPGFREKAQETITTVIDTLTTTTCQRSPRDHLRRPYRPRERRATRQASITRTRQTGPDPQPRPPVRTANTQARSLRAAPVRSRGGLMTKTRPSVSPRPGQ